MAKAFYKDELDSRTPQGVRGLKFARSNNTLRFAPRRTPQGVRGLKYLLMELVIFVKGRTPQGVRGLKWTI